MVKILGIETSCDETAAAVVDDARQILSNVVLSQVKEHAPYGGVVPEIAARAHIAHGAPIITQAMAEAGCDYGDLDAVAVTAGPGLIRGLIVGVMLGKGIAAATGAPCIAVNHLEGHALTPRLSDDVAFPYLLLLVSGGHCQIVVVEDVGKYVVLGGTIDDAMGEAFDKVAKMLGLGYPGGPPVERMAKQGDATRFAFPRPLLSTPGGDFSFSGLKTAVYRSVAEWDMAAVTGQDKADVCASFQAACGDVVDDRMAWAIAQFKEGWPAGEALVVAGGVAANQYLRGRLEVLSAAQGLRFVAPPMRLCTDNAAMIAWAGVERFTRGLTGGLDFAPRARWGLDVLGHS